MGTHKEDRISGCSSEKWK